MQLVTCRSIFCVGFEITLFPVNQIQQKMYRNLLLAYDP